MSFDPSLPLPNSSASSAVLRSQFNGLKALIDALQTVSGVAIDSVTTLPPGSAATVTAFISSGILHLSFGLPQGNDGAQGPPGEVTYSELNSATAAVLAQTSNNTNGVGQLGMVADGSYQQWQLQAVIDKLDELIAAARRT